jgi:hypothetical protein
MAPKAQHGKGLTFQALIKKVWEVSWDMRDHLKNVCMNTIAHAKMGEIANLNEQITERIEGGIAGLDHKDHH